MRAMRSNRRQEDVTGEMSWSPEWGRGRKRERVRTVSFHLPEDQVLILSPAEKQVIVLGLRHVLSSGYDATAAVLLERLMLGR